MTAADRPSQQSDRGCPLRGGGPKFGGIPSEGDLRMVYVQEKALGNKAVFRALGFHSVANRVKMFAARHRLRGNFVVQGIVRTSENWRLRWAETTKWHYFPVPTCIPL